MRSAAQVGGRQAEAREGPADDLDVARLAGVRGEGERQRLVVEPEAPRRAALEQRQRLHRLDRAAHEDRVRVVPGA